MRPVRAHARSPARSGSGRSPLSTRRPYGVSGDDPGQRPACCDPVCGDRDDRRVIVRGVRIAATSTACMARTSRTPVAARPGTEKASAVRSIRLSATIVAPAAKTQDEGGDPEQACRPAGCCDPAMPRLSSQGDDCWDERAHQRVKEDHRREADRDVVHRVDDHHVSFAQARERRDGGTDESGGDALDGFAHEARMWMRDHRAVPCALPTRMRARGRSRRQNWW